jgi:hypothetical protein
MAGCCLHGAFFTLRELFSAGIEACLQAGTMCWPLGIPDDGESITHYSYVWSPDQPASQFSMSLDQLPEMHTWVGIVETQEVIDIQTGLLSTSFHDRLGHEWPGPQPPDFFWGTIHEAPDNTSYEPIQAATLLAFNCIHSHILPHLNGG